MVINITDFKAMNGTWFGAIEFINNATSGNFISLILVALWFILAFVLIARAGFLEGVTVSSFAMFIISLIFQSIGSAGFGLVIAFFGVSVIGSFMLYARGRV